jgi:L-lactate dehydrogenase complex protein LldG
MSARERMLARIRQRQGKPVEPSDAEREAVLSHIAAHGRSPGPRDAWDAVTRFRDRALSLASTLDEAADTNAVPGCVARYLTERGLPLRGVCWRDLAALDWGRSGVRIEVRAARDEDLIGITTTFCGISETGTLMAISGADTPPSVSLLPETHIAVLSHARIVRSMEDAWALYRAEHPALPRAVSFISGPSRTADIEQTVTLGAHGPYRVHIILVAGP